MLRRFYAGIALLVSCGIAAVTQQDGAPDPYDRWSMLHSAIY